MSPVSYFTAKKTTQQETTQERFMLSKDQAWFLVTNSRCNNDSLLSPGDCFHVKQYFLNYTPADYGEMLALRMLMSSLSNK